MQKKVPNNDRARAETVNTPAIGAARDGGGERFGELIRQASAREPRQLVLLSQAQRALAEATSLDEIKDIRDKAEAARKYVESARLGLQRIGISV
jgi:hypothetical protein